MNHLLSVIAILLFAISFVLTIISSPVFSAYESLGNYYVIGVYAFEDKDYQQAEKYFLKALQKNPENVYCNYYLGKIYLKSKQYNKAKKHLNAAWKLIPESPGLKYDVALLRFKLSDYLAASLLFKEIAAHESGKTISFASYYAGMSLYKQGNYLQAINYLLDAAGKSQAIKENAFYYVGICFKKTGKPDPAIEKFNYLIKNAKSVAIQVSAQKQLLMIQKQQKVFKPFSLNIKSGIAYDNNVRLKPCDHDFYADRGDIVSDAYINLNYSFLDQSSLKLSAGLSHYQSWYNKIDDYDISGSSFKLTLAKSFDSYYTGFNYSPFYFKAGNEKFLTLHSMKPFVIVDLNENMLIKFSYDHSILEYEHIAARDGYVQDFSTEIFFPVFNKPHDSKLTIKDAKLLRQNKGFNIKQADLSYLFGFSVGLAYEDFNASISNYSYDKIKARLKFSFNMPLAFYFHGTAKYNLKQYDKSNYYYNKKQKDAFYYGEIALSRKIGREWLQLTAKSGYGLNSSNIDDFEYKRVLTGLFLEAYF